MSLFVCTCVIFIGIASFVVSNVFRIQSIEVVGEGISLAIDKAKMPNNLIFFPSQKITSQLLAENPLISEVRIEKKFPQTLVIHILRRPPIAKLRTDHQYLLIGKDGIVVGDASREQLPELQFPADVVSVGERIRDLPIAAALLLLENSSVSFDTITQWDSQSLKARTGKTDIIIAQDGEIVKRAATLQTLMLGFRMKGLMPTHIDLRFEKPIVVF